MFLEMLSGLVVLLESSQRFMFLVEWNDVFRELNFRKGVSIFKFTAGNEVASRFT